MTNSKQHHHIAFIHHGAVPGGAPTSLLNLASELSENKQLQITICCPFSRMLPFFQQNKSITVVPYPRPCKISGKIAIGYANIFDFKTFMFVIFDIFYSPISIMREYFFLKRLKPDIVHLNSSILWTSAIATKLNRYPLVWHVRENLLGSPTNIRRKAYAFFLRRLADQIICISPSEAVCIYGDNSDKCHVIYNSINLSCFQKNHYDSNYERNKSGFEPEEFLILSLGGISFRKGAFQLIESLNFLNKSYKIVIAGENRLSVNTRFRWAINVFHMLEDFLVKRHIKKFYSWFYDNRLANSLEKVDHSKVLFPGFVDDLPKLISTCDVLVFAGTTPHFSRPIFEAWAMEKPVVVFDTPVMQKEVNDGVDGIIVKKHTAFDLSNAIIYLRTHPEECKKLGQNGWINSQEKFDRRHNARKVMDVYKTIVKSS